MNKVKVLIEGYAKETKVGWVASSTTTLIESNGKIIIVDPGINRKLLVKKLKEQGFSFNDITHVFMTHYHPDHVLLTGLFEKAIYLDGDTIFNGDSEVEYSGTIPETDIEVISTPGHSSEHSSLLVHAIEGKVVVAGDVFWWMENEEQLLNRKSLLEKGDPFVQDEIALRRSREHLLEIASWIVPGHGKKFKVER